MVGYYTNLRPTGIAVMGHWEEIEAPWYETRIVNCSFCGRMIPKRIWVGEGAERHIFCSGKCEQLAAQRQAEMVGGKPLD